MNRACLPIGMTLLTACWAAFSGCEMRSFFDPSKTGRFEHTPTTIPILERIDVIERAEDPWAKATGVTPEDLLPNDLTYRMAPGDAVTVEVFELLLQGQATVAQRRIGADGMFRLPVLGDLPAAGLTAQEFQDELEQLIHEKVIRNPQVNVVIEEGAGFQFTMYGALTSSGLYSLRRPDFHILDALALAGGVPLSTNKVFVIRRVPLSDDLIFRPRRGERRAAPTRATPSMDIEDLIRQLDDPESETPDRTPPGPAPKADVPPLPPTFDIDDLINRLAGPDAGPPDGAPASRPQTRENPDEPPIDIEDLMDRLEDDQPPGDVTPAAFAQESGPLIDIDDLEPLRMPPVPAAERPEPAPTIEIAADEPPTDLLTPQAGQRDSYIYIEERDEWVPVKEVTRAAPESVDAASKTRSEPYLERIIEIPFQRLKQGDSSYNIVIRPNDLIYIQEPVTGVVYIDGEISRPGVYNLPASGLTLSRLVAAAGGPGALAIPERVDLTRIVGEHREATIRLNLAAIRMKTQPDLYLKPDDHIIIGTNFWALPLAVFRNGLRMTYGYGFLLDRNFGNDVFGAPPVNRGF